jgi:hypothetical protein
MFNEHVTMSTLRFMSFRFQIEMPFSGCGSIVEIAGISDICTDSLHYCQVVPAFDDYMLLSRYAVLLNIWLCKMRTRQF